MLDQTYLVKKVIVYVFATGLVLFLFFTLPFSSLYAVLTGDVNGDGRVDIVDIGEVVDFYSLPASNNKSRVPSWITKTEIDNREGCNSY